MNKVLVVDDEAFIREMLQEYLETQGYEVLVAADGEQGYSLYNEHNPKVVISDLNMPRMNGTELIRKLDLSADAARAIIVLTGHGTDDAVRECFSLGVQSFLRKPVNLFELGGIVKHSMELMRYAEDLAREAAAREQAYKELERQHRMLKLTFDAMQEGVVYLDSRYIVQMVSARAAAILSMEADDAVGKPAASILGSPIAGPSGELMRCVKSRTSVSEQPARVFCPDGSIVPVSLAIQPIEPESSRTGWLIFFRDWRAEERSAHAIRFGRMVGSDPKMKELFALIDKIAGSNASVLIQGESGTGKELVAREVHDRSRRAQGPFHAVNCAAIAPELLESEFFGHEKGAFTGAIQAKPGRMEVAHGGTLFLDEVGEIPMVLQGKLLRALQEKVFERVGGTRLIQVDVRIVAATNRDLEQMVAQNLFREDLYFRLKVVPIYLPPLRERIQDVPLLANFFISELNKREERNVTRIAPDTLQPLLEHGWPGNIRELYNVLEYAFAVSKGNVLRRDHLPEQFCLEQEPAMKEPPPESERELILRALQQTNYNKSKAAALLGIDRSTLYRRRQKYDI